MPDYRRNPFDELEEMQRQVGRFLGHLAGAKRPPYFYSPSAWQPAMDIYETAEEVIVLLEAAGVDTDSLEISLDQETLTIRGERQDAPRSVRQKYHMAEITFGGFRRVIQVPVPVDPERASWSLRDGLLEVVLPKVTGQATRPVKIRII